jgi:hypothetical protein
MRMKRVGDKVQCIYCGETFSRDLLEHPPTVKMVNGYPAPCPYVGVKTTIFINDDPPFLMAVMDDVYMYDIRPSIDDWKKYEIDILSRAFGIPRNMLEDM